MFVYMYEVTHEFTDLKKSNLTVKKLLVEEKPKTYTVTNFEYVYPKKERQRGEYCCRRIDKATLGNIQKHTYSYTYYMFVLEDTEDNRRKFIEDAVESLNMVISSVRETLGNYIGYCDSIKSSDFVTAGR